MTTALVGYYEQDVLRLRYVASVAPLALDARILFVTESRPELPYTETVPRLTSFTADRTPQFSESDPAGGGYGGCNIVGGGVFLEAGATAVKRGQFYVRFVIQRKAGGYEECLCCGYVYDAKPFLSVGEHVEPGPGGGEGWIRTVTGANPAAASDTVSEAVPTNAVWRLLSFSAVLVTSSDAATWRTPNLIIDDGTTANRRNIWQGSTQAASLTITHLWQSEYGGSGAQGAGNVTFTDTDTVVSREVLPQNLFLREAYRIRIVTTNFDSTAVPVDDWAAPIFIVEEWLVI